MGKSAELKGALLRKLYDLREARKTATSDEIAGELRGDRDDIEAVLRRWQGEGFVDFADSLDSMSEIQFTPEGAEEFESTDGAFKKYLQ